MMDEVYKRHEYDVSAFDCYNQLIKILENESGITLPHKNYIIDLKINLQEYEKSKGFNSNWSRLDREQGYLVKNDEVTFDWWFSLYLSLVDSSKIPLILDYYEETWSDKNVEFVKFLQFKTLKIQEDYFIHDFKKNTKKIISWIRKNKKLNSNQRVPQNIDEDIGKSILFNSPYYGYLLNELLEFCEEDSKDDLRKVMKGEEIDNPVIFKSNFKKISFRSAIKRMCLSGDALKTQEYFAKWLFNNFFIRENGLLSDFKINGSKDVFRKHPKQTKYSQLKFDDWYK